MVFCSKKGRVLQNTTDQRANLKWPEKIQLTKNAITNRRESRGTQEHRNRILIRFYFLFSNERLSFICVNVRVFLTISTNYARAHAYGCMHKYMQIFA